MRPKSPSIIKTFAILIAFAVGTVVLLVGSGDVMCSVDIERRLPLYPDAEVVATEYNFLRPRAIGVTLMRLHTDDDEEAVRQFYRDHTLALLDEGNFNGLASVEYRVQPDDDDGTNVILYSECGQ